MASTITAPSTVVPHLLRNANDHEVQATPKGREARDVLAAFNYYKDPGDGNLPPPTYVGKPETFEQQPTETRKMLVHDIRGEEDSTGASQILIFDHTIRRSSSNNRLTSQANDPPAPRGPVQRVHIDQSYKAGPDRVRHHLPADADRLLKGRYQIINVWRPIKTVRKDPLGVVDATSVPDDDLLPVQLIYPDRVGETFGVKANEGHRWHYLGEQTPGEVLLIKCFDSKVDGRARRVPHSAFVDPATEGESPRESIEVRALVFHPDDVE